LSRSNKAVYIILLACVACTQVLLWVLDGVDTYLFTALELSCIAITFGFPIAYLSKLVLRNWNEAEGIEAVAPVAALPLVVVIRGGRKER
jgi:hypothetical protein